MDQVPPSVAHVSAEALPLAVLVVDSDDRIVDGNAVFTSWVGLDPDAVRGQPLTRHLLERERSDDPGTLSIVLGEPRRPVLVSRTATPDGGSIVALTDATARATYERQLLATSTLQTRTRTRLELVIEASIAFAAAETSGQLADILATTVARAYRAEHSAVYLLEDDLAFSLSAGHDPLAPKLPIGAFVARAALHHEVIKLSGLDEARAWSPDVAEAMDAAGVQAIIAAPLRHDSVSMGVFVCFFHHARRFDAEAAPLADALAGQAAQVATTLRLQRQLEHAATHDSITGLPNRRYLEDRAATFASDGRDRTAAVFIDLDGFKRVNDELGHHVGDHVLREVGRRLRSALRDDDVVARYGGDEFIVICNVPDASAARDLAERLRRNLTTRFDSLPDGFPVGASFGIALSPVGETVPIDSLVRAADQAMYRSKAAGGGHIVVDRDPLQAVEPPTAPGALPIAPNLVEALTGAVGRGEISAWFQPQIDLATGAIVGAEALCRWQHPEFGAIGPATFIPIAEDSGLIAELGRFMTEQACFALDAWSTPHRPLDISVNVSPLQLRTSEFTEWLADRLRDRRPGSGTLTLEITESRPIADLDAVLERLEILRSFGVGLAIDDFGAGHASLDELVRLHGTEVKLDRSLVTDASDRATREIANAVAVAHRAEIRVVAEGVETDEHLERAKRLGCDRAQGFLIGHAVPASEFGTLLTR